MICPHCGKDINEPPEETKTVAWFTAPAFAPVEEPKKPKAKKKPFNDLDWKFIRGRIKRRDNYECVRCKTKENLEVHHIVPRDDGGGDHDGNLVTLCDSCHNYCEIAGFALRSEIIGSYNQKVYEIMDKNKVYKKPEEDVDYRPGWHKYVYGGEKNPMNPPQYKPDYHRFYGMIYEAVLLIRNGSYFAGIDMNFCTLAELK